MRIATDIGGTFTDLVGINKNGEILTNKAHTTPPNYEEGVMEVLKEKNIFVEEIEHFIHGSTVVINTLTERKGAKTGLITTRGFRDVLEIARGNRPDLFNLKYQKPVPFVERHLRQEVAERLSYKGEILQSLPLEELENLAEYFRKENIEALAIVFLHSYINPIHEIKAKEMLEKLLPHVHITASYEVTREWREYERTNTTVLNAYVKPTSSNYLNRLHKRLKEVGINKNKLVMQSNGGTTDFNHAKETPINIVESGPSGGVYGAAHLGELIGIKDIIAFDVGGTTAKCSLIKNNNIRIKTDYFIERDDKNAGYPIKIPVVDIVEIGNGGGSIAKLDKTGSIKVGPKSAGAFPGPVAYGNGGEEPTITDANIILGRLSLRNFDKKTDKQNIKQVMKEKIASPLGISVEEAALGIIRMANSNMLQALKLISVRKGYDPKEFALLAYGGGGSLHAAALSKDLRIKKVIIPKASAVFSAWGMLMTDLRKDYIQTHLNDITEVDQNEMDDRWKVLIDESKKSLLNEGAKANKISYQKQFDMRYKGQEHTVKVPYNFDSWTIEATKTTIKTFHQLHKEKYTYNLIDNQIEIVNLHLTGFGEINKVDLKRIQSHSSIKEAFIEERYVLFEEKGWLKIPVYKREKLSAGINLFEPSIIEEETASTVIYPNQSVLVDDYGNLIIENKED